MFVVEVIPLSRGSNIESLTYYSSVPYPFGSIISVPVRKSESAAMVVRAEPVSTAKTAVRAATFSLRKLPEQTDIKQLPPSIIETAKSLQDMYPAQLGAILFALLPPEVRAGEAELEYITPVSNSEIRPEIDIIQAKFEDRFIEYRSKIRETFAHRGSVLFVVPTSADIAPATQLLSQGIEDRLVVFSSTLTKKRLAQAYASFYDLRHAKLIVTTPTHAYLDRHDLTHVIVEQSRNRHYTSKVRPYIDHRQALKTLAFITNRTMTLGDILPRAEDEQSRRNEFYATVGEHPKRISFPSNLSLIMQEREVSATNPFQLFSNELKSEIQTALTERKRMFIYAARRGIAPVVVCVDCGFIFRDPDSGTPYSLFRTGSGEQEVRWFLSTMSGKRIRAADTCTSCGSWRLRERGIGIQHIHSEMREVFGDIPIHVFDHTTATTHKKAQAIIGRFYDEKGSILLGTQMALPYLESPVDISVITSLDAARSIPSWKADEEFFGLLLTLRERTLETVYVQSRTEPDELVTFAKQGAVEQFYTDELALREALKYPPYATFVLLTWQDTKESVQKTEDMLTEILTPYKPRFYSAPQSIVQKTRRHCLIRVPKKHWPHKELTDVLRTLPPFIKIEVDPDRIV